MKVENCIFFQMTKACRTSAAFWAKKVDHLGVTASQAMVLNFLEEEDRVLSRTLGQKAQITSATMTGILDRLEKIYLVERQRHSSDRRAILICLTEAGQKVAKEINSIMVKAHEEYLELISPENRKSFQATLQLLSKT